MKITALILTSMSAFSAMGQTTAKDPDTLQALLTEVKQLRQNIEAMTMASQRVQIALYGLQLQDAAVARAQRRVDEARDKRTQVENARNHMVAEIQRFEAAMSSGTVKGDEQKSIEQRLGQLKQELDALQVEQSSKQATEAETSSLLRTQQAKLGEMQDRIERLDKALASLGDGKK